MTTRERAPTVRDWRYWHADWTDRDWIVWADHLAKTRPSPTVIVLARPIGIAADDILLIREAAAILNGDDMTTKPIKAHRYVVDPHGKARLVEKPARVSVSKKIAMKKSKKTKPVRRTP